jgi:hypothetical protein
MSQPKIPKIQRQKKEKLPDPENWINPTPKKENQNPTQKKSKQKLKESSKKA